MALAVREELAPFAPLRAGRLRFVPIRHHSPSCALDLERWLRAEPPAAVLVEGPRDAGELIDIVLDPDARAPLAIYLTFVDKGARLSNAAAASTADASAEPARFAGYFPLCDYSPELTALRVGRELGAALRFIDLGFGEQVLARQHAASRSRPAVAELTRDAHLRHSRYLAALAARCGRRDPDELWDHLFEARTPAGSAAEAERFFAEVGAYCALARGEYAADVLRADGTIAREHAMAYAIARALEETPGVAPIFVVTGGFHTSALQARFAADGTPHEAIAKPRTPSPKRGEADHTLMRYGFAQLDALSGYAAGMRAPAFHQRVFEALRRDSAGGNADATRAAREQVAAELLVTIGAAHQDNSGSAAPASERALISAADRIAALEHARGLARLRDHTGPAREDVVDAVRTALVKGEIDIAGRTVMALCYAALRGDAVGSVPASAGTPPLVSDFLRRARAARLTVDRSERRALRLDLYRRAPHRETSRLLHALDFLEVPFAWVTSGPDFVRGRRLERLIEQWDYEWTPDVESALIERSVYGASVREAAAARLHQAVSELGDSGHARALRPAVRLLVAACRMGLHQQAAALMPICGRAAAEDSDLGAIGIGLAELLLLWRSREPLEAFNLEGLPELAVAAYRRGCYLVSSLRNTPEDEAPAAVQALLALREAQRGADDLQRDDEASAAVRFDAELYFGALEALLPADGRPRPRSAAVVGAAAGLLHIEGRLDRAALAALLSGYLRGAARTADATQQTAFVYGLLAAARELSWREPRLVSALDDLLAAWDDDTFLRALPELRLAFAQLTPRETDRVAAAVTKLDPGANHTPMPPAHLAVPESVLLGNAAIDARVGQLLDADGLDAWVSAERIDKPAKA
ncbi:MAG: hypothetical protein KC503_17070 [Myxococcales bacterium]|nr:hypothetical protein [Myxococcales bacterium]